jgi:hypothetical protein
MTDKHTTQRNCIIPLHVTTSHSLTHSLMELSPSWEAANCAATQELPSIYQTRRFITVFTRALHWSLSWARSIQSIPSILRFDKKYFFFTGSTASLGPDLCLFQFHDHLTDGRTPWTSDQPVARPLPKQRTTQTQNKHTHQKSMLCVGFEPTISASERVKTVHALDCSATVTGSKNY